MDESKKAPATATAAPVLMIKTSQRLSLITYGIAALALALLAMYLWDKAGDNREEEVVARYEELAVADAELKLSNSKLADTEFVQAKTEIQTRYITRKEEVIKYVKEDNKDRINCKLTADFISVYNSSSSPSN